MPTKLSEMTYDYIIVGAGAAGSVLASRLSESGKHSICVIEAGGKDSHPFIHLPAGFVKTLSMPELMWSFASEPSPGSGNRSIRLPQGKLLGGSTSINGLVYNRGQAEDFDHWCEMGNKGWGYRDVLPYFRKSESWQGEPNQARGSLGDMPISNPQWRDPLCESFIETLTSLGVPRIDDYNTGSQYGTGYYQRFIHGRRRVSAATSFLHMARQRQNVIIKTLSQASRIIIENNRAIGIICQPVHSDGTPRAEPYIISARSDVILCAGTVNSPRLLQLSGIGNGEHLRKLGIQTVRNLPAVGENLQDHYFVRCTAKLKPGVLSLNQRAKGWRLASHVARWAFGLPNILALSPSMAFAFVDSTLQPGRPDYQFVFSPGSYKPGRAYELDDFPAVTVGFTQQRPTSSGYVRIQSSSFNGHVSIQPNYLQTEVDQQATIKGIRLCQQIFTNGELGKLVASELTPGTQHDTDESLLEFARSVGNTGYHLVGTCRMGPESDSSTVVSDELCVHGVDRLRVIDASVMPKVPSSNTCASTLMIAEKGAEMLLRARR